MTTLVAPRAPQHTSGVIRIGDTTRRAAHARSSYVDQVLAHLRDAGFHGAPLPLGYDEGGRQVLSYLPGMVPQRAPFDLTDNQIVSATSLVRSFHDATAGTPLAEGQEVVCHGDLGAHNTVFHGDEAVGLIDWDQRVSPGRRVDDLAHAAWCFSDLLEDRVPVAEQARRLTLVCETYPGIAPGDVLAALGDRLERARASSQATGRTRGAAAFDSLLLRLHRDGDGLLAG